MKDNFEKIYEKYADTLYRIALTYSGDMHLAQDIVQEAFIRYFKMNKVFQDDVHERAWFIRVTINLCHDYYRKSQHTMITDDFETSSKSQEISDLSYYLSLLPEKNRSVIILHYLEGYSIKEIANMLFCTTSAIKMRIARGKKKLAKIIKEENDV